MAEMEQVKARGDDHKFMQPQLCGKKRPQIYLFTCSLQPMPKILVNHGIVFFAQPSPMTN
jgi:hypothetical protein